MIKFGRITHPGENVAKEIDKAKKLRFDYVEIGIETPTDAPILRKKKSSITKSLKRFSYPSIGHTAWWYDLSSPYEEVRSAWIKRAKIDIKIAKELGIKLLNFHFLIHSKILLENQEAKKVVLKNYVNSFNDLSKFAKKYGMTLMLENGEEKFDYYKYVLDKVLKLKVHFDIGHAFISGNMKTIKKFISYFGNRIAHIHIHDNHGKQDEHLALGKGKIDWNTVVSHLKKINYDKTLTFEVFKSKRDLLKSRDYFRRLWNNK